MAIARAPAAPAKHTCAPASAEAGVSIDKDMVGTPAHDLAAALSAALASADSDKSRLKEIKAALLRRPPAWFSDPDGHPLMDWDTFILNAPVRLEDQSRLPRASDLLAYVREKDDASTPS